MAGLTVLPTQTEGSVGQTKTDAVAVPNHRNYVPMTEWNALVDAVVKLCESVGLGDGSSAGTLMAALPSNWIPAPAAAINANFDAADIGVHSIVEVAPTATRKMDLRDATRSYAFTLWQSNTAAFGVTIDVTTSGAMGWETDAGVDTDFPIPSFGTGVAAHVLIRVDLPNKRINCIPVT